MSKNKLFKQFSFSSNTWVVILFSSQGIHFTAQKRGYCQKSLLTYKTNTTYTWNIFMSNSSSSWNNSSDAYNLIRTIPQNIMSCSLLAHSKGLSLPWMFALDEKIWYNYINKYSQKRFQNIKNRKMKKNKNIHTPVAIKNWDELQFLFITVDHLSGTYVKFSEKLTF